jgi:hypothetical protein
MVVGVVVGAGVARADSIGLNFYGDSNGELNGASAGLPAVAQSNWNDLTAANSTNVALVNSGNTPSGATVTYTSSNNIGYFTGKTQGFTGGNATLYDEELYGNPSITISNIPYSTYDVYVYIDSDSGGRGQSVSLAAIGGGTVDGATFYQTPVSVDGVTSQYNTSINGNFLQGTNTDATKADFYNAQSDPDDEYPLADYELFTSNTATDLKITMATSLVNGASGLAAVEIVGVAVPEPASMGLLLGACTIGLLGLTRRRPRCV